MYYLLNNEVDLGWIPTKMGDKSAPDNLQKGYETQVWLAVSNEQEARISGQYFHHKKRSHFLQLAKNEAVQEQFLEDCEKLTGIGLNS